MEHCTCMCISEMLVCIMSHLGMQLMPVGPGIHMVHETIPANLYNFIVYCQKKVLSGLILLFADTPCIQ